MHEPTFKSLNELFTLPGIIAPELREAIVVEAPQPHMSSPAPQMSSAPAETSEVKEETLTALLAEAQIVIGKLQKALIPLLTKEGLGEVLSNSTVVANQTKQSPTTIEGVFNGREMIADDGSHYTVPENYASKSRLLEGDMLQMVSEDGRNYFKQKERVARAIITARLHSVDISAGTAVSEKGERYSILHAPLRFFRVAPGDNLTLEIPEGGGEWAAVVGKVESCYTPNSLVTFRTT